MKKHELMKIYVQLTIFIFKSIVVFCALFIKY
jgi:hypothetical protein